MEERAGLRFGADKWIYREGDDESLGHDSTVITQSQVWAAVAKRTPWESRSRARQMLLLYHIHCLTTCLPGVAGGLWGGGAALETIASTHL